MASCQLSTSSYLVDTAARHPEVQLLLPEQQSEDLQMDFLTGLDNHDVAGSQRWGSLEGHGSNGSIPWINTHCYSQGLVTNDFQRETLECQHGTLEHERW